MKEDIAIRWAEALESGKYKQTSNSLCYVDKNGNPSFCCLGVLAELAVEAGATFKSTEIQPLTDKIIGYGPDHDRAGATLNDAIMNWAGMKSINGDRGRRKHNLIVLNDKSKYSFKRIAKVIRKEYADL